MALPGNGLTGAPVDLDEDMMGEPEEQLTLADADERLPWLESDDDYEQPGVDTGRIVAFAAVGLLAVVVLLGTLYIFTRDGGGDVAVADGSTIEAPEEPYRTRPDDPGGRQVEGTGDTSFAVAEGQQVDARIDPGKPAVAEDARSATSATAPGRKVVSASSTAGSAGIGVQVGAYSSRAQAEAGWSQLAGRFEVLQGRSHRVLEGVADSGPIYRLQAVAGTVAEAETLCREIRTSGGDCQVKR